MARTKPDIFMPLYIGDYIADTLHLTTQQHGAYLLLLMAYWRNGGPLVDDDEALAAIAKVPAKEWGKMRPVMARFFQIGDGLWRHGRADHELAEASAAVADASARAKRAANSRWGNKGESMRPHHSGNAQAMPEHMQAHMRTHSTSNAQAMLDECSSPSPSQEERNKRSNARARKSEKQEPDPPPKPVPAQKPQPEPQSPPPDAEAQRWITACWKALGANMAASPPDVLGTIGMRWVSMLGHVAEWQAMGANLERHVLPAIAKALEKKRASDFSPSYLTPIIREIIERGATPARQAGQKPPESRWDAARRARRGKAEIWLSKGQWLDTWGPKPGQRDSEIDAAYLDEVRAECESGRFEVISADDWAQRGQQSEAKTA